MSDETADIGEVAAAIGGREAVVERTGRVAAAARAQRAARAMHLLHFKTTCSVTY